MVDVDEIVFQVLLWTCITAVFLLMPPHRSIGLMFWRVYKARGWKGVKEEFHVRPSLLIALMIGILVVAAIFNLEPPKK